jgi:hypothetical protein
MTITISRGNSATAELLSDLDQKRAKYLLQAEIFGNQKVIGELAKVCSECQTDNWDGDGAQAVLPMTVKYALAFIQALPFGIECPTVGVEPDGHITFEWYRHPRWILSISVSPEAMLYYAGLFGISKVNGAEPLFIGDGIPTPVLDLIQRTILHVES